MGVIRHPRYPNRRNRAILTDFPTGSSRLKPEHKRWLDRHVIQPLSGTNPPWVYLRGFASRNYDSTFNKILSEARVQSVKTHVLDNIGTDPTRLEDHITGTDFVGEEWSGGDENDNSPRWRSVEVMVTPNRIPDRPPVIRIPQPTELRTRRVRCWLLKPPTMNPTWRGAGWADGGRRAQQSEAIWRNTRGAIRRRLQTETAEIPVNFRVTMIRYSVRRWRGTFASNDSLQIEFSWGLKSGDSVLVSDWFASNGSRGNDRIIDRQQARRIYGNVAHHLRERDTNYR